MGDWDEDDDAEVAVDRAPICPLCGVTALLAETGADSFVCENPDCDAYGDAVG